jgi:hypothetical protein
VASHLDAGEHAPMDVGELVPVEADELVPVEAGVDGEADACPAVVGKGGEDGSKPAGRRNASEQASSRWLLRAGGRRPFRLSRR